VNLLEKDSCVIEPLLL